MVCSVESYTVRNSLHLGFWLNAVVYSAESDSTQWFAVQSPNSTQWFAVWSPTVRNSLHFAVRSPNLRSGLQCRVQLYTVVCSVESDFTQWVFFAVLSLTLCSRLQCGDSTQWFAVRSPTPRIVIPRTKWHILLFVGTNAKHWNGERPQSSQCQGKATKAFLHKNLVELNCRIKTAPVMVGADTMSGYGPESIHSSGDRLGFYARFRFSFEQFSCFKAIVEYMYRARRKNSECPREKARRKWKSWKR